MTQQQNYITEDTTIKGHVTTAASLTVAGAVEGDINAGGEIVILGDAMVRGDVSGQSVTVQGTVVGRINASGRLVITSGGTVNGDISIRSLLIEEGGTLQGECKMGGGANGKTATSSAKPPPPPTSTSTYSRPK
jgi:cytoskeletal protein CcmA (bactofilin family)